MRDTSKLPLTVIAVTLLLAASANASYNASDNAADLAYNGGWHIGSNGGNGFGAWNFDKDLSQYTIGSSPGIDVSNKSWAVTAEYGTSAIRPFAGGVLALGQTVQVSWGLPGTNSGGTQVRFLDSANNPIINVLLNGGSLGVATNTVWGPGASVPWATNGASVLATVTLTCTNVIELSVVSGTNSVSFTNLLFTGSISAVALFVDGPNNTNLSGKTAYFNSLSVTGGINQVVPPLLNPLGGMLTNGQTVMMTTTTPGASIRYTIDGSLPTSQMGTVYSDPPPFSIIKPMTLNAIAYKTNMADSPITSAQYNPPLSMAVGNNLDGMVDWSTAWPFVDVFKRTRTWMTRNLDGSGAWDSGFGSLIPVDTNGWPTKVPFPVNGTNQMVHTIMVNLNEAGTYNFIYEGSGSLGFRWYPFGLNGGGANLTATGGVQSFSFTATATNTQASVEIYNSATNDYLRNFHIVLTNSLATYPTQPFHPLFLQRLQPFKCLRFMDWGAINYSALMSWTNRTTPSYYTQANPNGVALEYMVQLCNTLQKDAWICIPHVADDNYVQNAAQLIRDNLSPNLRVYVEYSNERWNNQFSQTAYVQTQGVNLSLDPDPYTAGQKYVARRSGQIWSIFQQVFGSAADSRLVKVMATQSAWTGVTDMRVSGLFDTNINVSGVLPDALAIAPYFGTAFVPSDLPPNAPYPTVDDILTNLSVQAIAEQQLQVGLQKTIADAHGWKLVCYEGGQTLQGIWGAENDTNLTAILTAANRDPRMFTIYTQHLDMLKAQGVDLFNNYSYCGNWGKNGNWGSLEFQDQPTNAALKYAALVQWIAANPIPMAPSITTLTTNVTVVQGQSASFNVSANGTAPLSFQWYWNGINVITGATNDTFTVTSAFPVNDGNYTVVVTNVVGSVTSLVAVLTVVVPPGILQDPTNVTANALSDATFNVTAGGTLPLAYQWWKDGAPLGNANGAILTLNAVTTNGAGIYRVVVTNVAGSVTSAVATLTVNRLVPGLAWAMPGAITYGAALGAGQLNASTGVPGSLAYSPVAGVLLAAGSRNLNVVFTPADSSIYTTNTANVTLMVNPAPLTITANSTNRVYGAANPVFTGTITGLQNSDNITATYNCSATTNSLAGTYAIVPILVDPNNRQTNYTVSLVNGTLTVTTLPVIQSAKRSGDSFTFTWSTTATQMYQIQCTTNLTQNAWTNLGGPIAATNSTATASDSISNSQMFYRVVLLP